MEGKCIYLLEDTFNLSQKKYCTIFFNFKLYRCTISQNVIVVAVA